MGGIGKTQTAVEYAYRYFYDTPTYEWVFWVKADTELNLVTDLAEIARSLHLGDGKLDELAALARHWLETHDRWLLIFDNADQPDWLQSVIPRHHQGRILLTSRGRKFVSLGIKAAIEIRELDQSDSIKFLQDRTNRPSLDTTELAAITALAQELGGLPLALEQAAAYIAEVEVSFTLYWKYYQQQPIALLEKRSPETGEYPQSVAKTWLLNFAEVEKRSPVSVSILHLSAVLAADDIPEELFLNGAAAMGLADYTDEFTLPEQLTALANLSLIRRDRTTCTYSIHRMVQAVVRHGWTVVDQQHWIERAIAGLNAVFPYVEFKHWQACERLVPHVQVMAARSDIATVDILDWSLLLNQTGYYLKEQGRYGEAEPLFIYALQIRKQLGADHPATATSMNNLAELYRAQGRYGEAEPLYIRALQIREQQFGSDHLDTAVSLNNLAELYSVQGRYGEAEPMYIRALQLKNQQFGSDHLDTAISLNNLAGLYYSQERYRESEALYSRALQIREKLGADHLNVAQSLNNLAALYAFQERYRESETLHTRALQIREQRLGAAHPDTATSLNNLGALYALQRRYGESETLYTRALQIQEQLLGGDHPDTATSLNNLAELYCIQGYYGQAEPLYIRALGILVKSLGGNHLTTQRAWSNFCYLVQRAVKARRTAELSNHSATQTLLQEIRSKTEE